MFLNVNLATGIIPLGTDLSQAGAGAYQAKYLAENVWSGFWALTLLNGLWILFSTHLGNTDVLIRTITDIMWIGSPKARSWRVGDILAVNCRLLPKPVRPGWVPKLFLLACCLFYSGFVMVVLWDCFIRP